MLEPSNWFNLLIRLAAALKDCAAHAVVISSQIPTLRKQTQLSASQPEAYKYAWVKIADFGCYCRANFLPSIELSGVGIRILQEFTKLYKPGRDRIHLSSKPRRNHYMKYGETRPAINLEVGFVQIKIEVCHKERH